MDAKKIIEMLSDRDVFDLLEELNAEPIDKGDVIECETICHHGSKRKLFFYKDTRHAHCYTNCGNMSIFDLVSNTLDVSFIEALKYIARKYNLSESNHFEGFEVLTVENPAEKLREKLKKIDTPIFDNINENILNDYYPFYHKLWLNDGININSMKEFGIRYDIMNNQIIIPHYDENGILIGVRARNLNKLLVDEGKKYMPVYHDGKVLKHLTGANLYGLNMNKKTIEELKTVILFESEKSVLQLKTMFPEQSIGVCISGSSLTMHQLEILKKLQIDEVIIAMDKEFENIGDEEEIMYAEKILKVFRNKLAPYFRVSCIWDLDNSLEKKMSPTDVNRDTFVKLLKNRIYI